MIKSVEQFATTFRALVGDEMFSIPDDFIINGLNWVFNSLPSVPMLDVAFKEHRTANLDAKEHYRWQLKSKFRRISNIHYINFYTSTGGEPCRLKICNRSNRDFYKKNELVEMKVSGTPCECTIEQEGDKTYLVLDRPSNIPIIIDYEVYGYPKPVSSMTDTFEVSAVVENLMLSALRRIWYMEASDFAFAGAVQDYLSNVEVVEAIQMLNKTLDNEVGVVLGGI